MKFMNNKERNEGMGNDFLNDVLRGKSSFVKSLNERIEWYQKSVEIKNGEIQDSAFQLAEGTIDQLNAKIVELQHVIYLIATHLY